MIEEQKIKLVTSVYYNILGPPHYGVERKGRLLYSLCNIANNTKLPIVCYTSKKYGCYDELKNSLDSKNITNVEIKIFELEDHPFHEKILRVRENSEWYLELYQKKPILVYWLKFYFLLQELADTDYIYWIDSGLSHNGLFPKRYSINPDIDGGFGMGDANCSYNFTCFSQDSFKRISNFAKDGVLHVVRPASDADIGEVVQTPGLEAAYAKNASQVWPKYWPIGGFFGGHTTRSSIKQYLEKTIEIFEIMLENNRLSVDEGIMAYTDVAYKEWFKRYHFENFYTEHEMARNLHWRVDQNGVEDGTVYHHFYRLFCDEAPLTDYLGNT